MQRERERERELQLRLTDEAKQMIRTENSLPFDVGVMFRLEAQPRRATSRSSIRFKAFPSILPARYNKSDCKTLVRKTETRGAQGKKSEIQQQGIMHFNGISIFFTLQICKSDQTSSLLLLYPLFVRLFFFSFSRPFPLPHIILQWNYFWAGLVFRTARERELERVVLLHKQ